MQPPRRSAGSFTCPMEDRICEMPATLWQYQRRDPVGTLSDRNGSHHFHCFHIDGGDRPERAAGDVDCLAVGSEGDSIGRPAVDPQSPTIRGYADADRKSTRLNSSHANISY